MAPASKEKAASAPSARVPTKQKMARIEQRNEQRASLYRTVLPVAELLPPYAGEYTEELGEALYAFIAQGVTLDGIASLPNMPPLYHLLRWMHKADHPFGKIYKEAKQLLVPLFEERAQTVASRPLRAVTETVREVLNKNGEVVEVRETKTHDNVARSALIVNTYQWTLAHLAPRKHGPKPGDGDGDDALKALLGEFRKRDEDET